MPTKEKFTDMFQSAQDRQFAGLLGEILDKIDKRFSELDTATQEKFRGAAGEIAKMRDDLARVQADGRSRFYAIAEHYHRGGEYRGPFRDAEQAAAFGRLVAAVATGRGAVEKLYHDDRFYAAISAESGEKGGFLMPEILLPGIVAGAERYGRFEANTRVWPVSGESATRAIRKQGATVYYPDYGNVPTESELTFDRIRTELTRYAAYAVLDRWMMRSELAVALGDYVAQELGYALAYATDRNGFVGDGTKSYARVTGLLNLTGSGDVTAAAAHDTFAEVIAESVEYLTDVAGALPDIADDENCKWYLHRELFWKYLGVKDTNDRPIADILTKGERPQRVLCGYPAEISQVFPKMADSAASTPMLALANLMRGAEMYRHTTGVELRVSEHVKFLEGEVVMALDVPQGVAMLDENMSVRLKTGAGE
jgi:HK97 family phage major capsid protein